MMAMATFSAAFAANSHAAVKLRISTAYPDGTSAVKSLKTAAEEIKVKTNGRVILKVYPGGVKGGNKNVLKLIKRGLLEGALWEGGAMAGEFKDGQVYNAPMVFRSYEEVDYVRERMDPELLKGYADAGWKTFGFIDGGFAYAMSRKPVVSMDDLNRQKLWLPANDPFSEKVAKALRLSPIFLGLGEVLVGLQTGSINAIVAPPTAALTLQWYTKVNYVTDAPFLYTYATLTIYNKAFAKLTAADQKLVNDILTRTISDIDKASRIDNLKAFRALETQGLVITKPNPAEAKELIKNAERATNTLLQQGEFSAVRLAKLKALLAEARNQLK